MIEHMAGIGIRVKWPVAGFKFFKAAVKFKMEKCFKDSTELPERFNFRFDQLRIFDAHFNNI